MDVALMILGIAGVIAFALLAAVVRANVIEQRRQKDREDAELILKLQRISGRSGRTGGVGK